MNDSSRVIEKNSMVVREFDRYICSLNIPNMLMDYLTMRWSSYSLRGMRSSTDGQGKRVGSVPRAAIR
jgi:hypothetical protein